MQLGELQSHLGAQLRVEVGEGLVEEEDRRLADDRAPERDSLALTARQLPWLSLEQAFDLEQLRRLEDAGLDLRLREAQVLEREAHVLPRPSCAGTGRSPGTPSRSRARAGAGRDVAIADEEVPRRRDLEAGHEPQERGLAAA